MSEKIKVLLDTDIGSDIDDAVCLAYLLAQPRCDLVGVTTVSGEPVKRASLADAICRIAGQDIPIYPGVENPMIVDQRQPLAGQARQLVNWEHSTDFPQREALSFMQQTIRDNPGEIALLSIGPLTNLGLLFAMDPELPGMLKQLVMMCGVFNNEKASKEWNAICDPHASAIVYASEAPVHRSIGLDVTRQVVMKPQEVKDRFKAELLQPVLDFSSVWFEHCEKMTFHDPLAAVTLFDESVCGFERGDVTVELKDDEIAGKTYWQQNTDGKHEAAMTVDADRFFADYFSVFE